MQSPVVTCSKCKAELPPGWYNLPQFTPCPVCAAPIRVDVYPALFRSASISPAANIVLEGEAGCFYHPQKKAVLPCDGCGRFLCALCDVDLNGQHLCPACLESGRRKGKLKSLEHKRLLYDRIALTAAILPPLVCLWPSLVGAPVALYVSLRYWKQPGSIVGGSKAGFVVAIILALLQIVGWIVGFIQMARS